MPQSARRQRISAKSLLATHFLPKVGWQDLHLHIRIDFQASLLLDHLAQLPVLVALLPGLRCAFADRNT
jgi:hypothetical protein